MKGTRHLARAQGNLDNGYVAEDRRICLVDVANQRVLRTVQHSLLMAVEAELDLSAKKLHVTFPQGLVKTVELNVSGALTCDYWGRPAELELVESPVNKIFSDYLGKDVSLALAPAGAVIYAAPFTLLGTATLDDLAQGLGHLELLDEVARFRATFLVETTVPFEEEGWEGTTVAL